MSRAQPRTIEAPEEDPEVGKREQNAARNRAAILEAARMAFCELGFGATTVRDIVRRTDLATGTFYNYYPSKEAVLNELIEDFQAELRRRVHEAREAAQTLEDLLRNAFRACFEIFVEDEMFSTLLTRNAGEIEELTSRAVLDPAAADLVSDLRTKAREGVVPELDFDLVAAAAIAVASALAMRHVRTPADVENATEFATQLFLGGIERMSKAKP